jgi:hypothetical protein
MTPKEKAKELVDKMYQYAPLEEIEFYSNDNMAIQCALIAVDEIINVLDDEDLYIQGETNIDGFINYFKEVKKEIEKL